DSGQQHQETEQPNPVSGSAHLLLLSVSCSRNYGIPRTSVGSERATEEELPAETPGWVELKCERPISKGASKLLQRADAGPCFPARKERAGSLSRSGARGLAGSLLTCLADMANVVIVGMQWGDEGKGKIVDLLCPAFDGVVRYQGGYNAGHTVKFRDRHFSLQLIPSGILHPDMVCVLGNGMVVAPDALLAELARLYEAGVRFDGRLFLSNRAHVLLPCHAALDQAREEARGAGRIGTTSRGIGPAYETKASRSGLRMVDLFAPDLEERLRVLLSRIQAELESLGGEALLQPAGYADLCRDWGERLKPSLRDTEQLLNGWIKEGKSLLFEGAQG